MSTIGATDSGPDRSVPALTIVSSLNFDLPETVTHKVFVIGEFVADCSLRASNFVVGDIQVDGKTFLNTRVNNLNGAIGETVVVSGVLTVPPGTHNFALRAFTDAANLFARHPTLSVVDLNRSEGALSVKWFGAKGDGQTDDTDAIIAATKAAAAIPAFNDVQQPAGVVTFANGGKYKCLKTMSFDMLANVVWRGPAQIDFQGLALVSMQGPPPVVVVNPSMQGNPDVTVNAGQKTYKRIAGDYVDDGFVVGMLVTFGGFTNAANNGAKTIKDVAAKVLTVSDTGLFSETTANTTCVARNTYMRIGGDYVADGFVVGMLVTFGGFMNAANNGAKIIADVAPTFLTVLDNPPVPLVHEVNGGIITATGSADFIRLQGCTRFVFEDLIFTYSNAEFLGRIFATGGSAQLRNDCSAITWNRCTLYGPDRAALADKPVQMTGNPNVTVNVSMKGKPDVSVDGVGQRYTRKAGSYITDGFVAGMLAAFGGFNESANNGAKIITAVTDDTLTVSDNSLKFELPIGPTTCVVRNSYARSTGSYIADGLVVGMLATFGGFKESANNEAKIITAVTDTVLYVSDGGLKNEGPIGNTTCAASSSQAAALISLDQAIVSRIRDCSFTGARVGVRGQTVSYSNAILIEGCVFFRLTDASVYQPGQGWYLAGNTFEPLANLPPNPADRQMNAVLQTLDYWSYGFAFIGNWVGDGAFGFGSWLTLKGLGICIQGNLISGNDPDSVIKIGGSEGIVITGNRISGSIEFVRDATPDMFVNIGALVAGNSHHSCTPIRGEAAGCVAGLCTVAISTVENKLTLPVHYGQEFDNRSKMSGFITGTFSWTPPPGLIGPGKFVEGPPPPDPNNPNNLNNLNGAKVGDAVHCGILPALPAGVIATAVMVEDNAVRVTIQNLSDAKVDLDKPLTVRVVAMN